MTRRQKVSYPITSLMRPQTKVDLIMEVDFINDRIDVRSSMALDLDQTRVILTQPSNPILKSMVGHKIDATFVAPSPDTQEVKRWGWVTQIVDVISNYRLNVNMVLPVVAVSAPQPGQLTEANNRLDYRLTTLSRSDISIQTHPSFGRINLVDFSAGGALITVPPPPQAELGMRLWFTLFFPSDVTINGEAEVIRIAYDPASDNLVRIGLKFHDLDLNATRTLQRMVNHFMLQEQRKRVR